MDKRGQIIDRVKALRARAEDQASSPSEVEAAAQRAAKLIAEHELTEAELRDASAEDVQRGSFNKGRQTQDPCLMYAAIGIATCR